MATELCSKCHDIGWVHPIDRDGQVDYANSVLCSCRVAEYEKHKQERYMKFCQLPATAIGKTFATFHTKDRADLSMAVRFAQSLVNEQDNVKWLTLIGKVGCGKTHLAVAICNKWLERGKSARYGFVPLLLKELRDGYDLMGEYSYLSRFNVLLNVPLLALDDLGVEKTTEWGQEQLQTIIHYRGFHGLPLVVTTNQPLDALKGDPDHRIGSRLKRETWCRVVVIESPEYKQ